MPSIEKRGDRFRIMVSMGYDASGSQIRKTTTFTPPAGVSAGKAEKLALAFAYEFQKQTQGMIDLDENIKFSELYAWYETNVAEGKLKPAVCEQQDCLHQLHSPLSWQHEAQGHNDTPHRHSFHKASQRRWRQGDVQPQG